MPRAIVFLILLPVLGLALVDRASALELDHPQPITDAPDSSQVVDDAKDDGKKDLPLVPGRTLELNTREGTWMSVDVSPDGSTVVFDLLGDLYTVPLEGGPATPLTAGLAFDSQPRYSPDGERIVFTSDRDGGENLWILSVADGESTQITKGKKNRYQSPEWTPDGDYIVASKSGLRYGRPNLWLWHVDGGSGVKLIDQPDGIKTTGAAFGDDGRYIWFARRMGGWQYNAQLPQYQLAIFDREHGTVSNRTSRYGSGFRPTLSPDGRWLVYGTRHDEETGLIRRDLTTGEETWLAYPVQHDAQEGRATRDVLPGMSFTPDSTELVCSYGGRIWRVPIDGSEAIEIPFEVQASVPLGPQVEFSYDVSDEPTFIARQIRDAKVSPGGDRLVFSALDHLWVLDWPRGEPRRLTRSDEIEQQPAWSPDGDWVAYATWSVEGGHLKKVRVGSRPTEGRVLTERTGVYREPAWSPDGTRVVALRSPARSMQEATGPLFPASDTDIVWVDASGGPLQVVAAAEGRGTPHFTPDPERIFLSAPSGQLVSIQWDGTDQKTHLKVTGRSLPEQDDPFEADLVLMGPDGKHALAVVHNNLYRLTVPVVGGKTPTVSVGDPASAAFPVRKLTTIGAQFPQWGHDGNRAHWSIGNAHFTYDFTAAKASEDSVKAARKAEKAKSDDEDADDGGSGEAEEGKEDAPAYQPEEVRVEIAVERDLPQGVLVLRGARVITMRGDEVLPEADVVVDGRRIAAVGRSGSVKIPAGAREIELHGKTIVPGFVDTHAHLRPAWGIHKAQPWQYLANLSYGVTTTRDPQTSTTDVLTYGDLVEAGRILGPRIYSTGPGVFWDEGLDDLDEARNVLRRYSDYYDTKTIKMYVAGNRQQRQWIIMAARELGLMPTTEGSLNMALNLTQIQDGYPGHEHNFPIYPVYQDVLDLCVTTQVCYTPTLLVAYGGPFAENYWYTTDEVHDDAKLRRFTPHEMVDASALRRPWFRREQHVFDEQAVFVKDLAEAGGRVGVGSHGQLQGLGYHWELWSMASGGVGRHDLLRAATLLGAEGLGLDGDLGSIEAGKLADLVVLDANPLENIRNTESVRLVMKNGRLYDGETLDEIWPDEKPLQRHHWWAEEPSPAAGLD